MPVDKQGMNVTVGTVANMADEGDICEVGGGDLCEEPVDMNNNVRGPNGACEREIHCIAVGSVCVCVFVCLFVCMMSGDCPDSCHCWFLATMSG